MITSLQSSDSRVKLFLQEKTATERKINKFSDYQDGWSYGRGTKFSYHAINDALNIVKLLHSYGFIETDAFPGESGEIMVTAYKKEFCCEIITYENMQYDFIIEEDDEEIERHERIASDLVKKQIAHFRDLSTCNLSEYLTPSILIKEGKDLKALPLKIQATTAEFRLSKKIASETLQDISANTSQNIMRKLLESPLSSGNFLLTNCHQSTN